MTSVIGHEDNGWASATMINGVRIDQSEESAKFISQQYAESMLSHEIVICGCATAGKISITCDKHQSQAKPVTPSLDPNPITPEIAKQLLDEGSELASKLKPRIDRMKGLGMPLGCGPGLCGNYDECRDCGRSPYPKWAPPLSEIEKSRSMLDILNKNGLPPISKEEEKIVDGLKNKDAENKSVSSLTSTSPKALDSFHKIPVNLCPASAIIAIAKVISLGHLKPGRTLYNWRSQPISYSSYLGAALRHLLKSNDGSDHDPELSELAGVPIRHDWAAMSCFAIIEDARQAGTLVDDRPVKGGAEKFMESLMVKK